MDFSETVFSSWTTGALSFVALGAEIVQPESRIQLLIISIKPVNNLFISHILPKKDSFLENIKFKQSLI